MSFITANTFSHSKIQSRQIHSMVEKSNNDAATAYNTKILSNDKKECIFGLNFFVNMPVKNSNCMFKSMPHLLSYDEWWDEPLFERQKFLETTHKYLVVGDPVVIVRFQTYSYRQEK